MKNLFAPKNLPVITAGLGGIALVLRKLLYTVAVDEKNLIPQNHPLEIGLGIVSIVALLYVMVMAWKLDGSDAYPDNFTPDWAAMVGHTAAAVGIVLTLLTKKAMMVGYLGTLWTVLGYLSPACLLLAGIDRLRGKQPFFALHLIPCLFLVFHIINHYQTWSGNPQFQDYVFTLLGSMALMLFAFYSTAFDVDAGRRRMHLLMGLAAVYLLMAELATTQYPWLYLGGIVWALTSLCNLTPVPKPAAEEKPKKER